MTNGDEFSAPRRLPAIRRQISEISRDDIRVRLLGTVIDRKENLLVMDDGTGKITVTFKEPLETKENQLVRVLGRVIPMETGFEIQGEVLQDMNKLDLDLRKKVVEVEKTINV